MSSSNRIEIIPPLNGDSLARDKRLLIPFKCDDKIGFFDSHFKVKVHPTYTAYQGDCYTPHDFIIVTRAENPLDSSNSDPQYCGVINCEGRELISAEYKDITLLSDNPRIYKCSDKGKCCNVYVLWYNEKLRLFQFRDKYIGSYLSIDPFREGLSRVSFFGWYSNTIKWGIINADGEKILGYEYGEIQPFYNNDRDYIELQYLCPDEETMCHEFKSISRIKKEWKERKKHCERWEEHYDLINDGLDGDAGAYWNID